MSNTNNNQVLQLKRLSPELAEVLHMLKSLETQPNNKVVPAATR